MLRLEQSYKQEKMHRAKKKGLSNHKNKSKGLGKNQKTGASIIARVRK